ncbi:LysR family transcriptional regulator [Paraburkholderia sp. Ac-20347]|jgi:LysR family transcriptional regulator, transcriptional activator for bauABCD operon|uniref:LysR family transcriptional regulator n=1 Tax=Paraburkholderia sp. Ac-20347 TaxID=2703892 RepID=UPI00197F0457|nr:LysR family transcriptional regulator [Paraburkholderia sp. Ac-20347]MBN3811607.1 LysR family transcriptional regulator [Paraburkholderia sp. Ac-20347]
MLANLTDFDLRLIRVFLAVVDARGLTAAQAALNVGQSTISTQLASLETRLGFRLCERGRGGFKLTAKGERFAMSARRLLMATNTFCAEAANMDRQLVGELNLGLIGHTPFSQNARISDAIARFRQRDQAVRFNIQIRSPGELEEQVLNGKVDIAIGYFWHRVPSLDYTSLFIERQYAYCGARHALFGRAAHADHPGDVGAAEAAACEWAWRSYPLPEAQHSTHERNVTAIADNMEAVALLILSGHHLGYLPVHFAKPYVDGGLLRAVNPSALRYDVTFHMVTRRMTNTGDIQRAFIEDLRAVHLNEVEREGAANA